MSTLTVGRLVGYLDLEDKSFGRGLDSAERDMDAFERDADKFLQQVTTEFARAGQEAGERLGGNLVTSADSGIRGNIGKMTASGGQVGEAIAEGADGRLRSSRSKLAKAGEQVGEGVAGGVKKGAQGIEDATDGPLRRMGGKAKAGAAAAGLAAGAAFAGQFLEAMGNEVSSDRAAAALLLNAEEQSRAASVVSAVWKQAYGETRDEVTGAVEAVMSSIQGMRAASEADLEALTIKAISFATAFEIDIAQGVAYASTLIGSHLAKDATHAFDLMARGASQVPKALREDFLETANEYAQFFEDLGFSGEQAFALLVKSSEKGTFGLDKFGDAIKESTFLMTDLGSSAVTDVYKRIGLDAHKMSNAIHDGGAGAQKAFQQIVDGLLAIKDPTEQATSAIALFGSPLEDLGKTEVPEFLRALDKAGAGMADVKGSMEQLDETLSDNAKNALTKWKRSAEENISSYIRGEVVPAVREFTNSADFKEWVDKAEDLGSKVKALWNDMVADIRQWAKDHKEEIGEFVDAASQYFGMFMDTAGAAIDFIQAVWNAGGEELLTTVVRFLTSIMNAVSGALQTVKGIFDIFTGLLTGDWDRFWKGITEVVHGQAQMTKGIVAGLVDLILAQFGLILKGVAKAFSWMPEIGPQLHQAERDFQHFRDEVNDAINGIQKGFTIHYSYSQVGGAPGSFGGGAMRHRAAGGDVRPGEMVSVNERGTPELFSIGDAQYLLNAGGGPGYVTPLSPLTAGTQGGGGTSVQVNLTVSAAPGMSHDLGRAIVANLQHHVRAVGGGNVQVALGRRR